MHFLSKIILVAILVIGVGCGSHEDEPQALNKGDANTSSPIDIALTSSEPMAMCQAELGTFIFVGIILALNLIPCTGGTQGKEKELDD